MKKILYRWENQREDRKKRKSLKIILGKKSCSNVVEICGDPAQEFGFYFNPVRTILSFKWGRYIFYWKLE